MKEQTQTGVLLDLSRKYLNDEDISMFVGPSDPGINEYFKAMKILLKGGEAVLDKSRYVDGDLDFDEPISCAQWDNHPYSDPKKFRWYRLMASSAALLLKTRFVEDNELYFLATILMDSFVLKESGNIEALVLASDICRELKAKSPVWSNEIKLFCIAGELVMAHFDKKNNEEIDDLCLAFERLEKEIFLNGDYFYDPYFWGTTCFTQLHPMWFSLIKMHFPTEGRAGRLRAMILGHGKKWDQN